MGLRQISQILDKKIEKIGKIGNYCQLSTARCDFRFFRAFRVQIILCDSASLRLGSSASLRFINKEADEKEGLEGKEMLFAIFTGF